MKLNRTHILTVLGVVAVLGSATLWVAYDMFLRDATTGYAEKTAFNIYPEASIDQIADSLVERRILSKRTGFVWLAKWSGWGDNIKAGHYEAEVGASNVDLLNVMRKGLQTPIHMVVPAGTRKERMIRGMARDMAFSTTELTQAFANEGLARELNTDTTHLWAFMIPDTYFFYWLSSPEDVIRRLKLRYDEIINAGRDTNGALPLSFTPDEVVRLAGIVEWESGYVPEKPVIAGVYMNRLRNKWALQADPTIQYAIMKIEGDKRRLFFKDYQLNDPYNTYKYKGLPPGPITNPSLTSIQSILNPESHNYFFFVAKGDGQHIFSRTLAEHTRNAQEYYRVMRQRRAEQQAAEKAAKSD